jgi:hypothetical protein
VFMSGLTIPVTFGFVEVPVLKRYSCRVMSHCKIVECTVAQVVSRIRFGVEPKPGPGINTLTPYWTRAGPALANFGVVWARGGTAHGTPSQNGV